jgi:hypothetical protein
MKYTYGQLLRNIYAQSGDVMREPVTGTLDYNTYGVTASGSSFEVITGTCPIHCPPASYDKENLYKGSNILYTEKAVVSGVIDLTAFGYANLNEYMAAYIAAGLGSIENVYPIEWADFLSYKRVETWGYSYTYICGQFSSIRKTTSSDTINTTFKNDVASGGVRVVGMNLYPERTAPYLTFSEDSCGVQHSPAFNKTIFGWDGSRGIQEKPVDAVLFVDETMWNYFISIGYPLPKYQSTPPFDSPVFALDFISRSVVTNHARGFPINGVNPYQAASWPKNSFPRIRRLK